MFSKVGDDGRSESRLRDPEPLPFEPLPVTTFPAFIPDAGDPEGPPPVDDDGALEGGGGGAFVVFGFGTGTIESSPLVGPHGSTTDGRAGALSSSSDQAWETFAGNVVKHMTHTCSHGIPVRYPNVAQSPTQVPRSLNLSREEEEVHWR